MKEMKNKQKFEIEKSLRNSKIKKKEMKQNDTTCRQFTNRIEYLP